MAKRRAPATPKAPPSGIRQAAPGPLGDSNTDLGKPGASIAPVIPGTLTEAQRPDTGSSIIDAKQAQDVSGLPASALDAVGVRGIANWGGIQLPEPNPALQLTLAFGLPGNQVWGEWEKLARTNPAASTALEMVCSHLRDARVEVEQNEDNPDEAQAEAQASYVEDNIKNWLEPKWPQLMHGAAWGQLAFGFHLREVVYGMREDERVPGGTAYYVKKLADRLPSTLRPDGWIEKDDELAVIRQVGQKHGNWHAEVDLPANKVLLFSWNRTANNYQGFPATRPVWYLCKLYEELEKMLAIGMMREALGMPFFEVEKDAPKLQNDEWKKLQALAQNLIYHENAGAALPPGVKMNWLFSKGADKHHILEAMDKIKLTVFEVFMTQQAALGTGNTGSRAVGSVHQQQKTAFVQGVIANTEAVLNGTGDRPYEGLVSKILVPNWGKVAFPPRIKLTLQQAELSPVDFTQALQQAVAAGAVTITTDDENTVREKLGLAPIDDAQRDAERAKRAALAPQGAGVAGSADLSGGNESVPKPTSGDGTPAAGAGRDVTIASEAKAFTPWRSLRPAERVVNFREAQDFLDGAPQRFEDGAKPLLVEMLVRALPAVRAAAGKPDAVAALRLDTTKLKAFAKDWILGVASEGYREVQSEREKSAQQVVRQHKDGGLGGARVKFSKRTEPLQEALRFAAEGEGEEGKEPAEETEDFAEVQSESVAKSIAARAQAALEREAIDVERTSAEPDEVVSEVISDALDAKTLQRDARGVLTKAWSMGREQFAKERADEVESVEISALLDRNTCDYCREHDGDEYAFGTPEEEAMTPPLRECEGGDACRCLKVFSFKSQTGEPDDSEGDE